MAGRRAGARAAARRRSGGLGVRHLQPRHVRRSPGGLADDAPGPGARRPDAGEAPIRAPSGRLSRQHGDRRGGRRLSYGSSGACGPHARRLASLLGRLERRSRTSDPRRTRRLRPAQGDRAERDCPGARVDDPSGEFPRLLRVARGQLHSGRVRPFQSTQRRRSHPRRVGLRSSFGLDGAAQARRAGRRPDAHEARDYAGGRSAPAERRRLHANGPARRRGSRPGGGRSGQRVRVQLSDAVSGRRPSNGARERGVAHRLDGALLGRHPRRDPSAGPRDLSLGGGPGTHDDPPCRRHDPLRRFAFGAGHGHRPAFAPE